jgi:hypothetical protein
MKNSSGTLGGGNLLSGSVEVLKDIPFMNLRYSDQSEISVRFLREIYQTDIVQKEFNM